MSQGFITNINMDLVSEILHKEKFYFVYQPIVDLKTNIVESYEALVRFKFDRTMFCSLQDFINILEVFCAEDFNELLYQKLLKDLPSFPVPIHFNLSSYNVKFLNNIKPDDRVIFEITEEYIHSQEKLEYLQKKIKEGFKIGIDDFGKGYNSLSHFFGKVIDFSFVKFDKTLILNIENPSKAAALEKFRAAFEEDLKVKVIVEGVETLKEFMILASLGFNYGQGYFIQKPQTLTDLLLLKFRRYIK